MNVFELLFESASEEAKRLGLRYHGWRLWKDASGTVVAKSEGDKLVFLPKNQQYNPSEKDSQAGATQPHPEEIEASQAEYQAKQEKEREKLQKKSTTSASTKKKSPASIPASRPQAPTPKAGQDAPLDYPPSTLSPNDVATIQRISGETPKRTIPSSWNDDYFREMTSSPHIKPYIKGAERLHKRFGGDIDAISDWIYAMQDNLKNSESYRNIQLGKPDKNEYKIDRLLTTLKRLERASAIIAAKNEYDEYKRTMKANTSPSFAKITPQSDIIKASNLKLLTQKTVNLLSADEEADYLMGKSSKIRRRIGYEYPNIDISTNRSLKTLQLKLTLSKSIDTELSDTIDAWIDTKDLRYDNDPGIYTNIKIQAIQKKHPKLFKNIKDVSKMTSEETLFVYKKIRDGLGADETISDELRARIRGDVEREIFHHSLEVGQERLDAKYEEKFGSHEKQVAYISALQKKYKSTDWFPQTVTVAKEDVVFTYEDGKRRSPLGTYNSDTKEITIYPRVFQSIKNNAFTDAEAERLVKEVLSHERQHHHTHEFVKHYDKIIEKVKKTKDFTLSNFQQTHPTEAAFFVLYNRLRNEVHAEGQHVSLYAKKFWDIYEQTPTSETFFCAIDETVSEMVAESIKKKGKADSKTINSIYKKSKYILALYNAINLHRHEHNVKI